MSKTHVPLDQIRDNPHQARIGTGDVDSLAATILEHGLRQLPEGRLLVEGEQPKSFSKWTETYNGNWILPGDDRREVQLASGHRRVEAVRVLRDDETVTDSDLENAGCLVTHSTVFVPIDLQRLSDNDMLDLLTVENAQREELSPVEQARLIGELAEAGRTGQEIAERFGKSASWVSNRKRLLELPQYVQTKVHEGGITVRQAGPLVNAQRLQDEHTEVVEEASFKLKPGTLVKDAERGVSSSDLRDKVQALQEHIETVLNPPDEEQDFPELPDGWKWAADENSDYSYRAVRRYDDWKANGAEIWLVATGDTATRAIDQAIHFDTYFVDHDPSGELVDGGEVIRPLPAGWVWVASSAKVDGIPVYTPYHFVDGTVDDPGAVRKWASGKDPFDKAEEAWGMHRRSQESTDQSHEQRERDCEKSNSAVSAGAVDDAGSRSGERGDDRGQERSGADAGGTEEALDKTEPTDAKRAVESIVGGDGEQAEDLPVTDTGGEPGYLSELIAQVEADGHDWQLKSLGQGSYEAMVQVSGTSRIKIAEGDTPAGALQSALDSAGEADVGQVVPAQVDALLSAKGEDMWDPDVASAATIASLLVAHRVAGQRQETWRTREIADIVQERAGSVTEDDVPTSVMEDVQAEVESRLRASVPEETQEA